MTSSNTVIEEQRKEIDRLEKMGERVQKRLDGRMLRIEVLEATVKNADEKVLNGAIALGCLADEIAFKRIGFDALVNEIKHLRARDQDRISVIQSLKIRELDHVATIDELTQTIERMLKSKAVAGLKASGGAVVLPSEAAPRPGTTEFLLESRVPKAHTKLGPGGDFTRELND